MKKTTKLHGFLRTGRDDYLVEKGTGLSTTLRKLCPEVAIGFGRSLEGDGQTGTWKITVEFVPDNPPKKNR